MHAKKLPAQPAKAERYSDKLLRSRIQTSRRKAILAAALDCFASHGVRGSTLSLIAKCADISKPNLLYYFNSKQELYTSVLQQTLIDWLEPLATLTFDGDPKQELTNYINKKLEFSFNNPKASRLFATEILQGAPFLRIALIADLKPLVEEKVKVLRRWQRQGKIRQFEPHQLIYIIWACTQHYADFRSQIDLLQPQQSSAELRQQATAALVTILLDGILVPDRSNRTSKS